jgi:hypothetical protein
MQEEMLAAGLLPEVIAQQGPKGARSYASRVYLVEKIIARQDEFKNFTLKPWLRAKLALSEGAEETKKLKRLDKETFERLRNDPEALEAARLAKFEEGFELEIDSIYANITGTQTARIMYEPIKPSSGSALKERALDIGDELLDEWISHDPLKIAERYARSVVPDVILARRGLFGADWTAKMKEIGDEFDVEIAKATDPKAKLKLTRQRQADIKFMNDLQDLLRNRYATNDNTNQAIGKATSLSRKVTYMAFLGGATISSLVDIGMIPFKNGLMRTFRTGIVPLIADIKSVKLALREMKLNGAALDWVLNTRAKITSEIGDDFATGQVSKVADMGTNMFSIMNLLAPWNAMMKQWSGVIQQTRILETLDALAKGSKKINKQDLADLSFLRLEGKILERVQRQIKKHGLETEGAVKTVDTRKWTDLEARLAYRAALKNAIDNTILTPGLGDKPLFMSTELGKTILQFQSFAMSATTRLMLSGMQSPDLLRTFNGLAIMTALGLMVEGSKNMLAGKEAFSGDAGDNLIAAIDRTGMLGYYGELINKGATLFGQDRLSSRYAARNFLSSILGPSIGVAQTAAQATAAVGTANVTQNDINNVRRLIPYNQIWWFKAGVDAIEQGFNETLGIPKKGRR